DELASQEAVTEVALNWLRKHAALTQGPMRTTRAIARKDIIQALEGFNTIEMEQFIGGWFTEETQTVLQGLFAKK
ncbi:MAG: enoyl-CoA hydratase/isomerase family protein, partial [Arenimonas sp.]|nr:enoyl-CoA hydratase/isomerase family protein [Arenimonas sp.]